MKAALPLLVAALILPLGACSSVDELPYISELKGVTDDGRLDEVRSALEALNSVRREADALRSELGYEDGGDEAQELKGDELSLMDYSGMKDEVLDSALTEIEALRDFYADMNSELRQEKQRRQDEQQYEDEHAWLYFHVRNLTGYTITGIRLSENGELSEELLPEGITAGDSETLLGLAVEIYVPAAERKLVLTDGSGNTHSYELDNEAVLEAVRGDDPDRTGSGNHGLIIVVDSTGKLSYL